MREWRNVLYKAPWRCVGKLRELAETQSASNSLWIWIQSHFKATSSQNKQLCSFATYLHFMPILDPSLLFWPQLSIKSQLPAFHIPQSGGRKLQFSSPTLFNSLENRNTSWRSGCIKSIYRLNLLQSGAWIRPVFSCCCYSAKPGACVCLHRRPVSFDGPSYSWSSWLARRSSPNGHKSVRLTVISVCLWLVYMSVTMQPCAIFPKLTY